jgi:hypothetical protein
MQRSTLLLFFFLFYSQVTFSQIKSQSVKLSLSNNLKLSDIGLHKTDQFNWILLDSNQQIITQNSGASIFDYIFGTPGQFFLKISNITNADHEGCKHENSDQLFEIKVANSAVHFDVEHITFSPQLNSSNIVNGVEMTIPVDIKLLAGSQTSITTNDFEARFQGVGCNITAKVLNPQVIHQNGSFFIQFFVKGTVEPGSYIMIDFLDPSGKITTYYHTTEL